MCYSPPSHLPVPPSPFEVQVSPQPGAQKVRAWGPGLEGGVVGRPADFVVEAIGTEVGTLGELGGTWRWGALWWGPWLSLEGGTWGQGQGHCGGDVGTGLGVMWWEQRGEIRGGDRGME